MLDFEEITWEGLGRIYRTWLRFLRVAISNTGLPKGEEKVTKIFKISVIS
jgi:hypothetical protein